MKKRYEVWADYVDTCLPCYLTDHHNREGEMLLGVCPSGQTSEQAVEELMEEINGAMYDSVPEEVGDEEIHVALTAAVEGVDFRTISSNGDRLEDGEDEDEDPAEDFGEESQAWFVLSWKEIPVVAHRVFIEVEVACYDDQRLEAEGAVESLLDFGSVRDAFSDAGLDVESIGVVQNDQQQLEPYVDMAQDTMGQMFNGCIVRVLRVPGFGSGSGSGRGEQGPASYRLMAQAMDRFRAGVDVSFSTGPCGFSVTVKENTGVPLSVCGHAATGSLRAADNRTSHDPVVVPGAPLVHFDTERCLGDVTLTQYVPGREVTPEYVQGFKEWIRGEREKHPSED
jgi:hypothetical protein